MNEARESGIVLQNTTIVIISCVMAELLINEVVTINGKTYKADEHGVLIGFSEMKGIDVSSAQGVIDWSKVKADGVDFVIVRAMHWSNSANNYVMDSMFVQERVWCQKQPVCW